MDAKTAADLMQPKKDLPSVLTLQSKMQDDLTAILSKTLVGFELDLSNKRAQKILFEAFVAVGGQFAEAAGMSTRSRYKYADKGVRTGTTIAPVAPEALEPADLAEGDDAADDSDDE